VSLAACTSDETESTDRDCFCGDDICEPTQLCNVTFCSDRANCSIYRSTVRECICNGTVCEKDKLCNGTNCVSLAACTSEETEATDRDCFCGDTTCVKGEFCIGKNCSAVGPSLVCSSTDGTASTTEDCTCGNATCFQGELCNIDHCSPIKDCSLNRVVPAECACGNTTCALNQVCPCEVCECEDFSPCEGVAEERCACGRVICELGQSCDSEAEDGVCTDKKEFPLWLSIVIPLVVVLLLPCPIHYRRVMIARRRRAEITNIVPSESTCLDVYNRDNSMSHDEDSLPSIESDMPRNTPNLFAETLYKEHFTKDSKEDSNLNNDDESIPSVPTEDG